MNSWPYYLKRSTSSARPLFELENTPYACLDSDITTPTARGDQTMVRLKMRNLLTSAVFEKPSRRATVSSSRISS
jgi:translation elongation factor P/translation initiation factor 5A